MENKEKELRIKRIILVVIVIIMFGININNSMIYWILLALKDLIE